MIPSAAETQADPVFDYNYQVSISISMFHTTLSYKIQKVLHFFVKRSSFFGQALTTIDRTLQIDEFFSKDIQNVAKEENLCLGKSENEENWNYGENVKEKLISYFENIRIRHKTDPFWMIDPDPEEIDKKKRILLLSNIEIQNDDSVDVIYEAQFQLNGIKEMIEFIFSGNLNKTNLFEGFATLHVIQVSIYTISFCWQMPQSQVVSNL